jgi:hypothetical protein
MDETTPVVEPVVEPSNGNGTSKRMPHKGRETFLSTKETLEKELKQTPSLQALAKKAGVSYPVMMNWLKFHDVEGPAKDDRAVAKFYESVELDEATGCWLWRGKKTIRYQEKSMNPARFALSVIGRVSNLSRKRVLRSCGNPLCINPEHLVLKSKTTDEKTTEAVAVAE